VKLFDNNINTSLITLIKSYYFNKIKMCARIRRKGGEGTTKISRIHNLTMIKENINNNFKIFKVKFVSSQT